MAEQFSLADFSLWDDETFLILTYGEVTNNADGGSTLHGLSHRVFSTCVVPIEGERQEIFKQGPKLPKLTFSLQLLGRSWMTRLLGASRRDRSCLLSIWEILRSAFLERIHNSSGLHFMRLLWCSGGGNNKLSNTLTEQRETEHLISSILSLTAPPDGPDSPSFPGLNGTSLRKTEHSQFLASTFFKLPAAYVSLDASRPWLMYWTVHSLDLLGVALDQGTKDRAISTLLKFQSPLGGFAGGPANSQSPHLLPTYAAVSSLAIVGNPSPGGGWDKLMEGRQKCYEFFMSCKRPDGGFVVCQGGEVDVRGTYCLLVVASLLDLLTPELLHNVDSFVSACQTYEGGFACSSFPFASPTAPPPTEFTIPSNPQSRASMAEAHGGYTSCALNSHFILQTVRPPPNTSSSTLPSLDESFPEKIGVRAALRWSVLQQGEAMEAGGFRGRTNKLVDGCYGWWVGGTFAVLEEMLRREKGGHGVVEVGEEKEKDNDAGWEDVAASPPLFNRVALQEYVLVAAQKEAGGSGGLRDKPSKRPDLYHTCNNLSGLSSAQHRVQQTSSSLSSAYAKFDPTKGLPPVIPLTTSGGWKSEQERQEVRRNVWSQIVAWDNDESSEVIVGGKESRTNTTTPVYNLLLLRLKPFVNFFYGQES